MSFNRIFLWLDKVHSRLDSYRKSMQPSIHPPRQLLAYNPYTPPDLLLDAILRTDCASSSNTTTLTELYLILQWLQKTALPPPPPLSTSIGYRRFTKTRILQAKRSSRWGTVEGIARTLDPDSVHHGGDGNGKLTPEDEANEQALLRAIFLYIRAGRVGEIRSLCQAAKEPWRGAVARGPLVASCPGLGAPFPRIFTYLQAHFGDQGVVLPHRKRNSIQISNGQVTNGDGCLKMFAPALLLNPVHPPSTDCSTPRSHLRILRFISSLVEQTKAFVAHGLICFGPGLMFYSRSVGRVS